VQKLFAPSNSRSGKRADEDVIATSLPEMESWAALRRKAESVPPENATAKDGS
jgi:hypothetical protein